jgi:hypothetical protein
MLLLTKLANEVLPDPLAFFALAFERWKKCKGARPNKSQIRKMFHF